MKNLLFWLMLFSTMAAQANEIRSASGASCEQSDFQPWELALGGGQDNRDYYDDGYHANYTPTDVDNTGKYVGVQLKYSFGGAKAIDCSRFQSIVEREQEAHAKQLEMKIRELEAKLAKQMLVTQSNSKVKFK